MRRLLHSPQADEDLIGIWSNIAREDPDAADRLLDRIDEACIKLADFPAMGAARDEVLEGLRLFPIRGYLILYRLSGGGIEVLRVLHGARQWQDLI